VAPAPIENRLNAHPMVELSLVSGVGQPAAYAMVVLAEDAAPRQPTRRAHPQVEAELTACSRARQRASWPTTSSCA
jgi:long-chain acyl-CoA synthetase